MAFYIYLFIILIGCRRAFMVLPELASVGRGTKSALTMNIEAVNIGVGETNVWTYKIAELLRVIHMVENFEYGGRNVTLRLNRDPISLRAGLHLPEFSKTDAEKVWRQLKEMWRKFMQAVNIKRKTFWMLYDEREGKRHQSPPKSPTKS